MLRAKELNGIVFTNNALFIQEEFEDDSIVSEMFMSGAMTHIVYEAEILTPYITLTSKEYGWVDDTQRLALIAMWRTLDTTFTLTYDDDSTVSVRMAREKKLVFTPTHEGSCLYMVVIPLAKV